MRFVHYKLRKEHQMQKYSTTIGVIELRQSGIGYRTTKKRCNIGNSTVTLIINHYHKLGLSLDESKAMPPKKVEEAFYPPENLRRAEKELPDFFQIHQCMMAMEAPDLAFQCLEYKKEHPNGYQLSQFYKLYRDFLRKNWGQNSVSTPVERILEERMYIDWVGDQPELLTNPATDEILPFYLFFLMPLSFQSFLLYPLIFLPHTQ